MPSAGTRRWSPTPSEEIDETWVEGVTTVGVTSGASVPEILVEGVLEWLAARGYEDVEVVRSAEEHQRFALPHTLSSLHSKPPRPGGAL